MYHARKVAPFVASRWGIYQISCVIELRFQPLGEEHRVCVDTRCTCGTRHTKIQLPCFRRFYTDGGAVDRAFYILEIVSAFRQRPCGNGDIKSKYYPARYCLYFRLYDVAQHALCYHTVRKHPLSIFVAPSFV